MTMHSEDNDAEEVDAGLLSRFSEVLDGLRSLNAASELTGNSAQQISKWRKGKAKLPFRQAAILAKAAGRSVDWLAFGDEASSAEQRSEGGGALDEADDVVWVPLLDVIASAGPGYENARPFELLKLPFPRAWLQRMGLPEQHARFLGSRGDSMEPTIMDGAIVLVDIRSRHARTDGIYVLIDGPNVRIKRIAVGWQNAIVLISDNERYASETLAPPDAEALRVAGKVVWAGGEI